MLFKTMILYFLKKKKHINISWKDTGTKKQYS